MKNIITNIVYLLVGISLGYLVFALNRCEDANPEEQKVEVRVDTVVHEVVVEIPKYTTKYVTRTDVKYETVFDSIEKWTNVYLPDTSKVAINKYQDSVKTEDYRLDYTIETLGHLVYFDPKFTVYEKRPVVITNPKPKWMVSGAVSQNATFKLGLGYKGVTVEGEFNKKFKQIYIGKQFVF